MLSIELFTVNSDIDVVTYDLQGDMFTFAGKQVKSTGDFELTTWLVIK